MHALVIRSRLLNIYFDMELVVDYQQGINWIIRGSTYRNKSGFLKSVCFYFLFFFGRYLPEVERTEYGWAHVANWFSTVIALHQEHGQWEWAGNIGNQRGDSYTCQIPCVAYKRPQRNQNAAALWQDVPINVLRTHLSARSSPHAMAGLPRCWSPSKAWRGERFGSRPRPSRWVVTSSFHYFQLRNAVQGALQLEGFWQDGM